MGSSETDGDPGDLGAVSALWDETVEVTGLGCSVSRVTVDQKDVHIQR